MHPKRAKGFLQFILDSSNSATQKKYILINCSLIQVDVIVEILFNLLKNISSFSAHIQTEILKRKYLINKFISSFKNKSKLRKLLKSHSKTVLQLLLTAKKLISSFLQ